MGERQSKLRPADWRRKKGNGGQAHESQKEKQAAETGDARALDRVRRSKRGVGGWVSKAGRWHVLLRLPMLHEETWHHVGYPQLSFRWWSWSRRRSYPRRWRSCQSRPLWWAGMTLIFFFFYLFFFLLAGDGLNENCKDNELFVYIHTTLSFLFTCLKLYFHG